MYTLVNLQPFDQLRNLLSNREAWRFMATSVPANKYTLWSERSDVPTEYWMCIPQVRVKDLQLNKKQPKEGGIHTAGIHIR